MKRFTALSLALIFIFLLGGCSNKEYKKNKDPQITDSTSVDKTEQEKYIVPIDWSDFIKINGITYIGDWRESEITFDRIGKKIGEVTAGVPTVCSDGKGNMTDDTPVDGASFLCRIGTELFAVKGSEHSIAALVDGKYYLYTDGTEADNTKAEITVTP